jgi:Zn-dependent protease
MIKLRTIPLGRPGGCSLRLDPALIPALLYLEWQAAGRYQAGLLSAGILAGLILHEAAHLFAVWLSGGRTRRAVLTLLGGRYEIEAPGRLAQVEWRGALIGPIVSIVIGGLLMTAGRDVDAPRTAHLCTDLGRFHFYFGVVNLVPAFPFDGGRVMRALLARTGGSVLSTRMVSAVGKAIAIGCLVIAVYGKLVPLLFVAIFLYAGAVSEERHEWLASPLEGVRVGDAVVEMTERLTVRDLVADAVVALQRSGQPALPVLADDGATVAAVAVADLRQVPPRDLWCTTLGDLLPGLGKVIGLDADLAEVQRRLIAGRQRAVAVVDGRGDAIGALSLEMIEGRISLYEIVAPAMARAPDPSPHPAPEPAEPARSPVIEPAAASFSTPAA